MFVIGESLVSEKWLTTCKNPHCLIYIFHVSMHITNEIFDNNDCRGEWYFISKIRCYQDQGSLGFFFYHSYLRYSVVLPDFYQLKTID